MEEHEHIFVKRIETEAERCALCGITNLIPLQRRNRI